MKKILLSCFFLLIILFSLFYPTEAILASKNAMLIWSGQILPTLLPFSILSAVLLQSNFFGSNLKYQNQFAIGTILLCGFMFGFPIGSKLASDFYKKEMLIKRQAHILAICANNFSPMYVCGFVLPTLFPNTDYKTLTYLLLYLFPLILGAFLLMLPSKRTNPTTILPISSQKETTDSDSYLTHKKTASRFQLDMQIIDAGIISSFETLIKLCGYIVMFSLLSTIFQTLFQKPHLLTQLLIGNMEITNGIALFCDYAIDTNITYLCSIQMLSLGGISGFAQTASILHSSGLSIKRYVLGKCILSLATTLLAVLLL